MTDLSKLSDAELQKLYGGVKAPTEMSDDELKAAYGQPKQRTITGILTGSDGGERYQTWPERAVRGILSLPQRTIEAAKAAPPGSQESIDALVPVAAEVALTASPVNPAIRAGDRIIPGVAKAVSERKPVVPTTQELYDSGVSNLNAFRDSGLELAPAAISDWSRKVQQALYDKGISPIDAEKTFAKLRELETPPTGDDILKTSFTSRQIKSLRESLGATAQNFNPQSAKDQFAATNAIKALDEFVPNIDPAHVMAGSPAAAGKLLERGRGDFAAAQRSNDITGNLDRGVTGILEQAELGAQVANSGRNIDNSIRQRIASVLKKEKEVSGLTTPEIDALVAAAEGGSGRNTARYIGNLLGGGGGLGQSLMAGGGAAGGFLAGGPIGAVAGAAIPPLAGAGAKSLANHLARRDLQGVDELLRTRSPLYQERVANPGTDVVSPERRAALIRLLMQSELQPQ